VEIIGQIVIVVAIFVALFYGILRYFFNKHTKNSIFYMEYVVPMRDRLLQSKKSMSAKPTMHNNGPEKLVDELDNDKLSTAILVSSFDSPAKFKGHEKI